VQNWFVQKFAHGCRGFHTWIISQLSQKCSRKKVILKHNPVNCHLETMFQKILETEVFRKLDLNMPRNRTPHMAPNRTPPRLTKHSKLWSPRCPILIQAVFHCSQYGDGNVSAVDRANTEGLPPQEHAWCVCHCYSLIQQRCEDPPSFSVRTATRRLFVQASLTCQCKLSKIEKKMYYLFERQAPAVWCLVRNSTCTCLGLSLRYVQITSHY